MSGKYRIRKWNRVWILISPSGEILRARFTHTGCVKSLDWITQEGR